MDADAEDPLWLVYLSSKRYVRSPSVSDTYLEEPSPVHWTTPPSSMTYPSPAYVWGAFSGSDYPNFCVYSIIRKPPAAMATESITTRKAVRTIFSSFVWITTWVTLPRKSRSLGS